MRNILENTGSRNVDVAINIHSPNAYVVGANDKLVSASLSVEYNMFNINGENYDNN